MQNMVYYAKDSDFRVTRWDEQRALYAAAETVQVESWREMLKIAYGYFLMVQVK